jgi:hypothetical protein
MQQNFVPPFFKTISTQNNKPAGLSMRHNTKQSSTFTTDEYLRLSQSPSPHISIHQASSCKATVTPHEGTFELCETPATFSSKAFSNFN